jgi:hypothetical protein
MQKEFYEMHRSDAIQVLLGKDKLASLHTNLKLAEQLEKHFPEKTRLYLVKEDHLPLGKNLLTYKNF